MVKAKKTKEEKVDVSKEAQRSEPKEESKSQLKEAIVKEACRLATGEQYQMRDLIALCKKYMEKNK